MGKLILQIRRNLRSLILAEQTWNAMFNLDEPIGFTITTITSDTMV